MGKSMQHQTKRHPPAIQQRGRKNQNCIHCIPKLNIDETLPLVASALTLIFEKFFRASARGSWSWFVDFELLFELSRFEATGVVADAVFCRFQQIRLKW